MSFTPDSDSRDGGGGRFSRLRLRFSLRTLMIAVTAFAIGFPVWYRWPVREVKLRYPRVTKQVGTQFVEVEDKTAAPISRTVTTWRRKWGKGWVKSGPTSTTYFGEQKQVLVTHYDNGDLHGPFSEIREKGWERRGQFEHGKREGIWVRSDFGRGDRATVRWHLDRVHGPAEYRAPDGTITKMEFDGGRILHFNGQPVSSPLLDRLERGEIRYALLVEGLEFEGCYMFHPHPLTEWWDFMSEAHYVPLLISPNVLDRSIEIDGKECCGINLQAALVIATQKVGLDCDYRYGCLWVTTQDDAKDWQDPTGIDEIRPRVGSLLSIAWNEPVKVWRFDTPLADAVSTLCQSHGVACDMSQISATPDESNPFPLRLYLNINGEYRSFRDLLGVLLYTTGCRCRLEGDKLVILPPETSQ